MKCSKMKVLWMLLTAAILSVESHLIKHLRRDRDPHVVKQFGFSLGFGLGGLGFNFGSSASRQYGAAHRADGYKGPSREHGADAAGDHGWKKPIGNDKPGPDNRRWEDGYADGGYRKEFGFTGYHGVSGGGGHRRGWEDGYAGDNYRPGDRGHYDQDRPYRGGDRPYPGDDRPYRGGDRPYRGGDRPYRGGDGPYRGQDRPYRGGDRPDYGNDRPYRGEDSPAPDKSHSDRDGPHPGPDKPYNDNGRPHPGPDKPHTDDHIRPHPGPDKPHDIPHHDEKPHGNDDKGSGTGHDQGPVDHGKDTPIEDEAHHGERPKHEEAKFHAGEGQLDARIKRQKDHSVA